MIGNASTPDLDTGWVDWFEDYPHPNDFFQPLLSGESIRRPTTPTSPRIDDPALNEKIAKLGEEPLGPEAGSRLRRSSTANTWNRRPGLPTGR